jgi:nucleoside-diphosphate-sugar epimerase
VSNKAKTILLTGVSGTLGFNVARLLAANANHKIVATVRTLQPFLKKLALGSRFFTLICAIYLP